MILWVSVLYSSLAFILAGVGVILILFGINLLSLDDALPYLNTTGGIILQVLLGTILLATAIYFSFRVYRGNMQRIRFSYQEEGGRIEISAYAIKELVREMLFSKIGIAGLNAISLSHQGDGIAISIDASISSQEKVTEIGHRIQALLTEQLTEQIGIKVEGVSVFVRTIRTDPKLRAAQQNENE
jgi:uncharacterized alkaline shock family protein YloU